MTIRQEMGKLFSCNLPAITSDNLKKLDIDENQKTEIERRFNLLQAQLKVSQVGGNPKVKLRQQEIATINNQNMIRVGESIRSVAFKQSNAQGLQGFLARDMAIVHDWMGMGRDFTNAGWVRESMNRIRRLWRGGINDMIRRYGMIEYTRKTYAPLVDMLKKKGLRQDQIDRIMTDAIEKSMYPIMRNSQNLGQRGLELLDQKYRNFIDSLYNVYHLTDPEVKSLVDAGEGMAQVYHRLATAAQDAGINVNETEVWGYFNRILSTDAERRYTWKWEDENHIRWNDNSATPVTESLLKSRTTSQYIVEDEVLLDYVLRSIGEQDGQDPTYYYKLVTGEPDGGRQDRRVDCRTPDEGRQQHAPPSGGFRRGALSGLPLARGACGAAGRGCRRPPARGRAADPDGGLDGPSPARSLRVRRRASTQRWGAGLLQG